MTGKLDVHQDQVGLLLGDRGERLLAVLGLDHLVAGAGQQIAQDLPVVLLVLDHQNALGHACLACRSTVIGSVKEKVEPWPGADSTQIRPPCISTMRLEIARPRPVPPFFFGDRTVGLLEFLEDLLPGRPRRCRGRCRAPRA